MQNEELQLQLAALDIQFEAEVEELKVERDAFKRHHDHALLEIESWKRRFARVKEEKFELVADFERFVAQCTCCTTGGSNDDRVAELTHKIAELELVLLEMQTTEQSNAHTIAQLKTWKRETEHEQKETHKLEVAEAQRDRSLAKKLEGDNARLQKSVDLLTTENAQLSSHAYAYAQELIGKKKETHALLDELAEIRLECSSKTELLLTSEAKCSRVQRELALLEDVSYLSRAFIDHDLEEDADSDEDVVDHSKNQRRESKRSSLSNADGALEQKEEDSAMPTTRESFGPLEGLMPSPFTAFPASIRAANGKSAAVVSPTDLESHKKLHHYFHLTAQSIIHENKLHEKCFKSSSRFTIDSWYREIISLDIPYLEWHAWLINRISQVAASVQDEDDREPLLSITTPESSARGTKSFGGFFLRKDTDGNSPVGSAAAGGAFPAMPNSSVSPSSRPRHVPFSVARAFFRLLRSRKDPELDSSSEE